MQITRHLFVLLSLVAATEGEAARAVPDEKLAFPVLITLKTSVGSGFFITTRKSVYLATAKHVLVDEGTSLLAEQVELTSYSPDPRDVRPNRLTLDLKELSKSRAVKLHPDRDVAVVRVADIAVPDDRGGVIRQLPGVIFVSTSEMGIYSAPPTHLKKFDEVAIGNDVIVFGYPVSLNLRHSPQLDFDRPLLRKGIVAGVDLRRRSIVVDTPVYGGNSGGPVVEVEAHENGRRFRIVGVVVEYVPALTEGTVVGDRAPHIVNSGYAIALPMDFVLELLDK